MQRLKTAVDYEEEIKRMSEWLFNNKRQLIKDRDTFDLFFKDFMNDGFDLTTEGENVRDMTFQAYRELDPNVLEARVFKEAGGKDLKADRKLQSRILTSDPGRFKKLTAQKSDFIGIDTVPAMVKKKVVKAKKQFIVRRKKQITVFRDSKGRFSKRL